MQFLLLVSSAFNTQNYSHNVNVYSKLLAIKVSICKYIYMRTLWRINGIHCSLFCTPSRLLLYLVQLKTAVLVVKLPVSQSWQYSRNLTNYMYVV